MISSVENHDRSGARERSESQVVYHNKKLYRAFSRQANGLTLNISVLQGLLRVNGKAEKDA